MSREVIVTLSDAGYLSQAKQLFSSVYHNSGWDGDYLLLEQGIGQEDLAWFREKGIEVRSFPKMTRASFKKHPATILGKFHLFSPEFKRWKKVIYLDSDIIVEASLDELKEVKGFNAVPDIHFKSLEDQFKGLEKDIDQGQRNVYESLTRLYDMREPAFNSGVMAFDTDIIKNEDMVDRLMDLYNRFGPVANSDQSIFNLFFYRNWNRLPLVYDNYFPYRRPSWRPIYVPTESIVQHFLWDKPWTRNDRHYDRLWMNNLSMARSIDLENRIGPKKVWTEDEKKKQEALLTHLNREQDPIKKCFLSSVDRIDSAAGKIGSFIRKLRDH
ncbi:MAG: glycosyltransferase [Thermoplasmatota archaeon]